VAHRYVQGKRPGGDSPFQVPIDVAVEEPRTGVVSEESNRDIIVRGDVAHADDVAHNGVNIIVSRVTGTPDHVERVPMQVDRVLRDVCDTVRNPECRWQILTHRSTDSACRDADLNALVPFETVDGPIWQKVRRLLRATQDLQ
jgi:hypothetical protein